MESIIIIFIIGLLIFEVLEHVILPLFFFIASRKKRSICGREGMIGKVGVIQCWKRNEGRIIINGEIWRIVSRHSFSIGDKAVVHDVSGLTLTVVPEEQKSV